MFDLAALIHSWCHHPIRSLEAIYTAPMGYWTW